MKIISPTGKKLFFNSKRVVSDLQPLPPIPENHYKYFKFVIEETSDSIVNSTSFSQGRVQLSQFQLYQELYRIPLTAILDSGYAIGDNTKENLVDGYTSTKWYSEFNNHKPVWVIFEADDYYEITKYRMATADDSNSYYGRNPVSWSLYASNTATTETGNWILIDKHINDRTIIPSTGRYFTFYNELNLPSEYTRLKAVNLNRCYIDTMVRPTTSDIIVCVCQDYGITTGGWPQEAFNVIFGSRSGSTTSDCLFMFSRFYNNRTVNYARCGNENNVVSTPNAVATYQVDNSSNSYKLWVMNNETGTVVGTYTKSGTSTTCSYNMWVGCGNQQNAVDVYCNADFYGFKIFDADGNMKVNLIPARRNSDNVCGFYDMAQRKFRTNLGTGTITGIDF